MGIDWTTVTSIGAGAFGGAAGAFIGWFASAFVGTPLRKFFDLRGEVIRRLIEFDNIRARYKEARDDVGATSGDQEPMDLSSKEIERLEDAQRVLRELAAHMRAFDENEPLAIWFVRKRYDPAKASRGLIGLSNAFDTYGGTKAFQRQSVHEALRIKP